MRGIRPSLVGGERWVEGRDLYYDGRPHRLPWMLASSNRAAAGAGIYYYTYIMDRHHLKQTFPAGS